MADQLGFFRPTWEQLEARAITAERAAGFLLDRTRYLERKLRDLQADLTASQVRERQANITIEVLRRERNK